MIDYLAIFAYIACDWLRGRACRLLARRGIMPMWNIDGSDQCEAVYKTQQTVFARKNWP